MIIGYLLLNLIAFMSEHRFNIKKAAAEQSACVTRFETGKEYKE